MSEQPTANLQELLQQSNLLEQAARLDDSTYQLQWGSALVVVGIKGRALVIISPLFKGLPAGNEREFCQHLLHLNSRLGGIASFAIQDDGWVVLHGGRDVKGMDSEEFALLVITVARAADQFDNELLDQFYTSVSPEEAAASAPDEATDEAPTGDGKDSGDEASAASDGDQT